MRISFVAENGALVLRNMAATVHGELTRGCYWRVAEDKQLNFVACGAKCICRNAPEAFVTLMAKTLPSPETRKRLIRRLMTYCSVFAQPTG